ncbi:MAG: ParB/RepB/Spo0J family partition protein [Propionibacteriales bacterium]|nr:ParB/RepB/Spo0J family partition protein [Propionibacteriales bacterium]
MSGPRRGLGRGLGSLIPTTPAREHAAVVDAPPADASAALAVTGAYFGELPIGQIVANPKQPRTDFDEAELDELADSLREVGLLQPIVVRPAGGEQYQLIMGERRWRAAQRAAFTVIPAIIRETSDDDLLRDALLENLHRSQLNPLEEAAAYQQLLDDFGSTHDELATRVGRSRPQISNTLRLLKLPAPVQRRVAAGILSAGHARTLLAVADPMRQEALATRVVAEGMSVRALEEMIAVGEDGGRPRLRRSTPISSPRLAEVAGRLSERLETRCKVNLGKNKGKITVEFASLDDLQRIVDIMGAGDN